MSTLSTTSCIDFGIGGSSSNYCVWEHSLGSGYSWTCGYGAICEAFADGKCIYQNQTLSQRDCDGNINNYTDVWYIQCCNGGDDCNYDISDVDIDSCTQSPDFENYRYYWNKMQSVEEGSASDIYGCDDDVENITCNGLEALLRESADGWCDVYRTMYDLVGSETKAALQSFMDADLENMMEWNDVFECDIELSCDLSSGTTSMTTTMIETTTMIGTTTVIDTTTGDDASTTGDLLATSDLSAANGPVYFSVILWFIIVLFV